MKKSMTLQANAGLTTFAERATLLARMPLQRVCNYYARLLERPLNLRQTLLLINAQAAFFFAVFPVSCPIAVRLLFFYWLITALLKCKRAL